MRPSLLLVCLLGLIAPAAAAQPTTEDGIRALLRGEDQAAVGILRPLAEDSKRPDPIAQFFLAIAYDTGRGVAPDNARACGLFLRAAVPTNPFQQQSSALAASIWEELGDAASTLCVMDETPQDQRSHDVAKAADRFRQIATADGVAAIARGDYTRAVRILKPIADAWLATDPAAEFFMAGLYDAGDGVPADALRSCALYDRAASSMTDPFGIEASRLLRASAFRGGGEFYQQCDALAASATRGSKNRAR